jgi:hypothetical protein
VSRLLRPGRTSTGKAGNPALAPPLAKIRD